MLDNITVTIPPKELEELVREKVREHFKGRDVIDVKFDVSMEWTGYGRGERQEPMFKGVTVTTRARRVDY